MKVVQLVPSLSYGDAIGNEVAAIHKILKANGYHAQVYAESIDPRRKDIAQPTAQMGSLGPQDILLYHFAIGSELNLKLKSFGGRLVFRYHNITPPLFFADYSMQAYRSCRQGRGQLAALAGVPEACLSVSRYNTQDLKANGYRCPITELPVLLAMEDYAAEPDAEVLRRYKDGKTNFVFVGRISPNKKIENVIRAYAWYRKHVSANCRLILAGTSAGNENYFAALQKYQEEIRAEEVIFTGKISFPALLAVYRAADLFLCMSEHEGFCVPLVEAMYFGVPIIAYGTSAIPDTLGGAGVCLDSNDPVMAGMMAAKILSDRDFRQKLVELEQARLQEYMPQKTGAGFLRWLQDFVSEGETASAP